MEGLVLRGSSNVLCHCVNRNSNASLAMKQYGSLRAASEGEHIVEEEKHDERTSQKQELWSPEETQILAALFRSKPASLLRRRVLLPQKPLSKFRIAGLPKSRRLLDKPPALSRCHRKPLLLDLAQKLHELPPGHHVSSILDEYARILRPGWLSITISELGLLVNPHRATEVLDWQQHFSHLWPDDSTLRVTIEVLARAGMDREAFDFLHSLAPTSADAFNSLLRALAASHRLDCALGEKKKMEIVGCPLDQDVYADLILLASRLNRNEDMYMLVQELGTLPELQLSLESCTSIMAACRKVGMHDTVGTLFEWWKSCGFHPNVFMYEIVITSLEKAGRHRDALAIYCEMEEDKCAPDLLVCKSLFKVCLELGECSKALGLLSRMREMHLSPTQDIYVCLIKLCQKDGRLGKAKELLRTMEREGMTAVDLEI